MLHFTEVTCLIWPEIHLMLQRITDVFSNLEMCIHKVISLPGDWASLLRKNIRKYFFAVFCVYTKVIHTKRKIQPPHA